MSRYGPHRPEDCPRTVTVRGRGKWADERQVEMPAALIEQRKQLNERAHRPA